MNALEVEIHWLWIKSVLWLHGVIGCTRRLFNVAIMTKQLVIEERKLCTSDVKVGTHYFYSYSGSHDMLDTQNSFLFIYLIHLLVCIAFFIETWWHLRDKLCSLCVFNWFTKPHVTKLMNSHTHIYIYID